MLRLTSADDGVLQRGAVLEDEDRVGIAALLLPGALDAAAVRLESSVEGAADGLGLLVGDGALGLGNGKRGPLGQAEELVGSLLRGSGGDGSHEGSGSGNDGELHLGELEKCGNLCGTTKVYSEN